MQILIVRSLFKELAESVKNESTGCCSAVMVREAEGRALSRQMLDSGQDFADSGGSKGNLNLEMNDALNAYF